MPCYIARTAAYLPGQPVANDAIGRFMGELPGEGDVREKMLRLNGIVSRHYAQDERQHPTHDVYDLAHEAIAGLVAGEPLPAAVTFLSVGTTYAPLAAPGIASIVHGRLGESGVLSQPVEINSHAGICTSSANGLVAAVRAVERGEHAAAIAAGTEHASDALKASAIVPIDDRDQHADVRRSRWFMSVFLRFMLSDGAGAVLLSDRVVGEHVWQVEWTHARSHAHERPLCMHVESRTALLSQDPDILARHLFPAGEQVLGEALARQNAAIDDFAAVLPHLSSLYFARRVDRMLAKFLREPPPRFDAATLPPRWTNLATAGNTGAASAFLLLDGYLRGPGRERAIGDRVLLLVPESGQFNFVVVSLRRVS